MARGKLNRRAFLRGAGGVSIGLPVLGSMLGRAYAQSSILPKRFVVFFSPNGTLSERWMSAGGERDFQLGEILQPLQAHRDDLIILRGIDMEAAYNGPGDGHQKGMGCMLTGTELLDGNSQGGCGSCPPAGLAAVQK